MEQSERRIGEPYLLTDPLIGDVINGIRNGFDTYCDKVNKCTQWYEWIHSYEREIEEDDIKVFHLIIQYSGITKFKDFGFPDAWECVKKGEPIPQNPIGEKLYLIDEERLLKDMPFLKENADILERKRKESYIYDVPVGEELTPVKSYLQAIIDLASIFSCYRVAVSSAATFAAYKQDEMLKAKATDFSPRVNTAQCIEAAKSLNTYFKPKEKFETLDKSEKIKAFRTILGGIITEEDNNDYSGRKTEIRKGEVRDVLSKLVECYEPKDNWWEDIPKHDNKVRSEVLAIITNCNAESIRTYSKKKEGDKYYDIKVALFG